MQVKPISSLSLSPSFPPDHSSQHAMRASQTQAVQPQPLPLPLPLPPPPLSLPSSPPAAPRRGLHRRTSASSSSSSSSAVSTASFFSPSPSPAPSPSPCASTTSVVPFSWERHPGVPKSSFRGGLDAATSADAPLPLPPPLRSSTRRRRRLRHASANAAAAASSARAASSDPFVAAFAECTRDDDDGDADHGADTGVAVKEKLWPAAPKTKPAAAVSGRDERRWWLAGGGLVGFLDLYGCKSAMAVADGAFLAHRPVSVAARSRRGRAARR